MPALDPNTLAVDATCFNCLPPGKQLAVETYLLAVIAGADTSEAGVNALGEAARCFSCLPPGNQIAIQNYLLTLLLS